MSSTAEDSVVILEDECSEVVCEKNSAELERS